MHKIKVGSVFRTQPKKLLQNVKMVQLDAYSDTNVYACQTQIGKMNARSTLITLSDTSRMECCCCCLNEGLVAKAIKRHITSQIR